MHLFLLNSAQTPKSYTSSEILLQLKKLNVLGSILYIAAHPDDENTRLLSYLANEKLYRTGYLSLTRGDGGQNLIGDEQGVDLGLIRTQELLAARRNDGAEQFFSRAYDFGYSKSPEEAMRIWGHDKILSDVVWVIRKFRPDVIITRFPTTGEGGHGHHTASAILATEAFDAAADPAKFPEQFKYGVTTWQPKRLFWNTFNFGGNNTQREDQLKIDVGGYNPVLGKSYGEIAATSRSQHKSQGFGVPAQRGSAIEYFALLKGDKPTSDLMEGIDATWARAGEKEFSNSITAIVNRYDIQHPGASVPALLQLYRQMEKNVQQNLWNSWKLAEIRTAIENCSGLFLEATAEKQLNVAGDSVKLNITVNNRSGINIERVIASSGELSVTVDSPALNSNINRSMTVVMSTITQPYWLQSGWVNGSFEVKDQQQIGKAEDPQYFVTFNVKLDEGAPFEFKKPVLYKYTDPVKGELYQQVQVVNPILVTPSQNLLIFKNGDKNLKRDIQFTLQANRDLSGKASFSATGKAKTFQVFDSTVHFTKGERRTVSYQVNSDSLARDSKEAFSGHFKTGVLKDEQHFALKKISYDHIPDIYYHYNDVINVMKIDLKTAGDLVGYIPGAGDKVPQALEQMGYKVVMLNESDLKLKNLRQFDAIITGIRAYNIHEWLTNSYEVLMQYVKEGGVLLTQYNTNNSIGPLKSKIAPYPFTISRNRVTDETAAVNFLLPANPALNYPNKITVKDFDGWIQERSIYNAENADSNYQKVLSMKDPGEKEQDGSLVIADYGKGRFVYTGLVFFRELPAAVPGAYRLFANLIANKRVNYIK